MAAGKEAATPGAPPEPVRVEVDGGRTVFHLEGVVGVRQAKRLLAPSVMLAGTGGTAEVRCEHLQHPDCAAVQVLPAFFDTPRSNGAEIAVQNLPDSVQQTLRNAGLVSAF